MVFRKSSKHNQESLQTIWKYELDPEKMDDLHGQDIQMPQDFQVISAGAQEDALVIWVRVYPERQENETCRIRVFGTGWDMVPVKDEGYRFINTVQMKDGLVFHIYVRARANSI